jgi:hypothetical protein
MGGSMPTMDKKKLQRLTLERLIAYRKYHAKAVGLAISMGQRSGKDEDALEQVNVELRSRGFHGRYEVGHER